MNLGHSYFQASGPEPSNSFCLAHRYDADVGFRPDAGASHVLEFDGTAIRGPFWINGWLTALWRSESGLAYVTESNGQLHIIPSHRLGARVRTLAIPGVPTGVWGLDDSNVWIWGRRGGKGVLHHFDGTALREVPSPGEVFWIHGLAPDFLVAVGERGLVSRWDGATWTAAAPVSAVDLLGVHVASPDEMYAWGKSGELLAGSADSWSLRYRHKGPIGSVAKWGGGCGWQPGAR